MWKFEVYKDNAGEFRWRLKAANGEIVATSSEGYTYKQSCLKGIELVQMNAASATVDDLTQK
jgi:uncharacterized protein YegP (UPF0339 family)